MHIKNLLDLFLEKNNAGNPFDSLNFCVRLFIDELLPYKRLAFGSQKLSV